MKRLKNKKKPTVKLICSTCREAKLVRRHVDYDIGPLFDLDEVKVSGMPALVCPKCKAVSIEGGLMDAAAFMIASKILELTDIEPMELRYLRKLLGYKQEEFAQKVGVSRVTFTRWETGEKAVTGPEAYAIRAHAFFRLRDKSPAIEAIAPTFVNDPEVSAKTRRLSFKGSELATAA